MKKFDLKIRYEERGCRIIYFVAKLTFMIAIFTFRFVCNTISHYSRYCFFGNLVQRIFSFVLLFVVALYYIHYH